MSPLVSCNKYLCTLNSKLVVDRWEGSAVQFIMNVFIKFLILSNFASLIAAECHIVINEVNIETPVKPEAGEFIELKVKTLKLLELSYLV